MIIKLFLNRFLLHPTTHAYVCTIYVIFLLFVNIEVSPTLQFTLVQVLVPTMRMLFVEAKTNAFIYGVLTIISLDYIQHHAVTEIHIGNVYKLIMLSLHALFFLLNLLFAISLAQKMKYTCLLALLDVMGPSKSSLIESDSFTKSKE